MVNLTALLKFGKQSIFTNIVTTYMRQKYNCQDTPVEASGGAAGGGAGQGGSMQKVKQFNTQEW